MPSINVAVGAHALGAMLVGGVDADGPGVSLWRAWDWPLLPAVALGLGAWLYGRGWAEARRRRPAQFSFWRLLCFYAGLLSLWMAIASPLDALDDYLLTAHMIQHFVLMSVAPPLLLLGTPTLPLLCGMPRWGIRWLVKPIVSRHWYQGAARMLLHPATLWTVMNVVYLGWHVPAAFELTFRSEAVHDLEHLCFFWTSLGFWWFVLQPWPAHSRYPRWLVIPYLLTSDLANTILSAILAFSGRVLYPSYAAAPRITSLNALQDQVAAGCEMWVLNSIVFLVPAMVITVQLLSPGKQRFAKNGREVVSS